MRGWDCPQGWGRILEGGRRPSATPPPHKENEAGGRPACLVLSCAGTLQFAFPKLGQALNLPQEQESSIHQQAAPASTVLLASAAASRQHG